MAFVSITRLRVRSWRFMPGFIIAALRTNAQARRAQGNLSVGVRSDARNAFWTSTVWVDEAAMRRFMTAGAHRKVMPKLIEWCDEASVVHWLQETDQAPNWTEAHRRMQEQGRPSRVAHPSEAQSRFEIPAPKA